MALDETGGERKKERNRERESQVLSNGNQVVKMCPADTVEEGEEELVEKIEHENETSSSSSVSH